MMILLVGGVVAVAVVGLFLLRRGGASSPPTAGGPSVKEPVDGGRAPPTAAPVSDAAPVSAAAPPSSATSVPAFDPVLAQTLCGDDPELLAEILTEMRVECQSQVAAIHAALAEEAAPKVHVAAHRLKGSLLMIAASPAAELAATIERLALEEELAGVPELLAALVHELERLDKAIAVHH